MSFKQKTAYEIEYGLVGWEMCIRDSTMTPLSADEFQRYGDRAFARVPMIVAGKVEMPAAVSYTHLTLPTSDLV